MPRKAIIIGGGWAGCAAAWKLANAGWKVALFEKSDKLGGRASSFIHPTHGELDNGQHLFLGAYQNTRRLLTSIGSAGQLHFQPTLAIDYFLPGNQTQSLQTGRAPGPLSLLG